MNPIENANAEIAEDLHLRTLLVLEQANAGELDDELVFQLTRYLGLMTIAYRAVMSAHDRRPFETTVRQWDGFLKTLVSEQDRKHPIPAPLIKRVDVFVETWRKLFETGRLTYTQFKEMVLVAERHLQKLVEQHDAKMAKA